MRKVAVPSPCCPAMGIRPLWGSASLLREHCGKPVCLQLAGSVCPEHDICEVFQQALDNLLNLAPLQRSDRLWNS